MNKVKILVIIGVILILAGAIAIPVSSMLKPNNTDNKNDGQDKEDKKKTPEEPPVMTEQERIKQEIEVNYPGAKNLKLIKETETEFHYENVGTNDIYVYSFETLKIEIIQKDSNAADDLAPGE